MTYHDNDVYLSIASGYTLINGTYTVNSYSVTDGQDPKGHIYNGLTVSCGSNGKLTFSVGRKGSSSVANWFNGQIPASQNTFNHTADDLNFAFLGTLTLTITGGLLGSNLDTITFTNVALAQGHSGASNNWWFGGKSCSYIQNNQVTCSGKNALGAVASFIFLRGGNDVSTVGVNPTTLVDTANWMKGLSDGLRLDQIMMPGSHDAGMSELSHCAPPFGADGYTQTQSGSIGSQLTYGSRYFDIRVDYDYDELVTYHRTDGWGCNGQNLISVLDQAQSFLNSHPSETAIFKFSHIRDYEGHDPAVTKQKIDTLLNNYSAVIYDGSSADVNLATLPLGNLRGKMILVFDYNDYINPTTGRFRYMDSDTVAANANISVFDQYSDTSDYGTMRADQIQKWQAHGGMGTGHLFLLSWTLTASATSPSVKSMADYANAQLPSVLYGQIVAAGFSKPNIVYIDYVSSTVAQSIILYNVLSTPATKALASVEVKDVTASV